MYCLTLPCSITIFVCPATNATNCCQPYNLSSEAAMDEDNNVKVNFLAEARFKANKVRCLLFASVLPAVIALNAMFCE